jgi:hypothetical protein
MLTKAIDRRRRWDRFPTLFSLALIKGIRDNLRARSLFATNAAGTLPALAPRYLGARTADGSYNDLSAPAMGMANTRFGRNVPLGCAEPEDLARILPPNPRLVSPTLLARGPQMIPARGLNVLAGAWLQSETRVCTDPILLPRRLPDPRACGEMPPTFVNTETHWWDASAPSSGP